MTNPKIIESETIPLADVKVMLDNIAKRDEELSYRSNKAKEYLDNFVTLSKSKKEELFKKLNALKLTRLRDEHIIKLIDFIPRNIEDLKVVLQAYPLSLPKKDQDAIVSVTKEFV